MLHKANIVVFHHQFITTNLKDSVFSVELGKGMEIAC